MDKNNTSVKSPGNPVSAVFVNETALQIFRDLEHYHLLALKEAEDRFGTSNAPSIKVLYEANAEGFRRVWTSPSGELSDPSSRFEDYYCPTEYWLLDFWNVAIGMALHLLQASVLVSDKDYKKELEAFFGETLLLNFKGGSVYIGFLWPAKSPCEKE